MERFQSSRAVPYVYVDRYGNQAHMVAWPREDPPRRRRKKKRPASRRKKKEAG